MTPNTTTESQDAKKQQSDQHLVELIKTVLDDAKSEDVVAINIREKSSIADYMVVASGRSNRHVGAIADQVSRAIRESGEPKPRVEGLNSMDWVLVDAGDVIVHIFRPEVREFYNIEKMWSAEFTHENAH